jgi:uncharacterized protein (DUF2236 family)
MSSVETGLGGGCPVKRQDLERSHQRIRRMTSRPEYGLFGPGSMMWRMASPTLVVPMMLLEAGLLEAPHPVIAFGTLGSESATDFVPRFHRSADAFYDWFFGDIDTALKTARRVFGYHSRVKGTLPEDIGGFEKGRPYEANEQDVLIWVWATIIRPLKEYYEHFEGRLTSDEVDRYYRECRCFALLFGIDDDRLPAQWSELEAYFDELAASPTMEMSNEFLSRSTLLSGEVTGTRITRLMTTWILSICTYRLPDGVATQYPHLPAARRHRIAARVTLNIFSAVWPRLPQSVRESPRSQSARRRVCVGRPTTFVDRWLRANLVPPYGVSYAEASTSPHGNPIHAHHVQVTNAPATTATASAATV